MTQGKLALCMGVLLGLLVLTACGETEHPDSWRASWKDRADYCYSVVVDPRGSSNTLMGWTDIEPQFDVTTAGYVVVVEDIRVKKRCPNCPDDYYAAEKIWATNGDGFVDITRRADCLPPR